MGTAMNSVVDKLNSFLRGEISAVETHRQALKAIKDPSVKSGVEESLRLHQGRVGRLHERIVALGGEPATTSGLWGAFARLVEGGARIVSESAAISALEEGEDHGLRDYRGDLGDLDLESRRFVESELLADQKRSHAILSALKHRYSASPSPRV
jgi:hypothetical protein